MTVIGALSSFRELGEMSPHKRACVHRTRQLLGLSDTLSAIRNVRQWRRARTFWPQVAPNLCSRVN
jgi:hypothetical protein